MYINKGPRDKQTFLQAEGYKMANGEIIIQELCLLTKNCTNGKSTKVQKTI